MGMKRGHKLTAAQRAYQRQNYTGRASVDVPIGSRFGRLIVIAKTRRPHASGGWRSFFECRCDCGEMRTTSSDALRHGRTQSCGCLMRERSSATAHTYLVGSRGRMTHGHTSTSGCTATYKSWQQMNSRCRNPRATKFENYGGRGISVTKPWRDSYAAFLNDMGERPSGTSIDRIDGRFGYFAANCRWATNKQQNVNRRKSIPYLVLFPKLKTLLDARTCR